ncbi:glycosyltransferase family 4 protein [Sphingobacterium multivorum]|uniref:glycosyltransferase family 4 protein n=1 Tax=Sphingobacterium multivorum TaxID=28454 RepID=UPI000E7ED566|nr:glycosyltransferase family 4 protein [Sphingobacterium multivorum]QQT63619.1 glycosyltransferase family 4 protein [Sphingobacterium multivorum]HBI87703.1 hypothetical protein [Sphingobacterium sp.]
MQKSLIIISFDFPPLSGGIARLCQEIAVGQKNNFREVLVLTTDKKGDSFTYNYDSIKRIEFPSDRLKCEIAMINYLRNLENPQDYIILTATWHPEGLIGYLSKISNLFILGHGTEFLYGKSKFRKYIWLKFYAPFLLNSAVKVIANSRYTARLIKSIGKNVTCEVLPLAVNEKFFRPLGRMEKDQDQLVISTVSRIEKFKGHDFIAKVISNLPENIKNKIRWNIAGTGPDLDYLKDLVNKLKIDDNVIFHGFVSDEDLPVFYNQSDVFVLCSREQSTTTTVEGFGLVFLEAQACGIPTIGTKTGGISDAISHLEGGWLIDQDDDKQLGELFMHLIEDKDYLKKQGFIARERIEKDFTWSKYNEKLFKILTTKRI